MVGLMDEASLPRTLKPIDLFLTRHGVDVGKALGVLTIAAAVESIYGVFGQLLLGHLTIDLGGPMGLLIGFALWRHAPWARKLLLVVGWVGVVALGTMLVAAPFTDLVRLNLTLGKAVIVAPSLWQAFLGTIVLAPLVWFVLAVLHSETAKAEFRKRCV